MKQRIGSLVLIAFVVLAFSLAGGTVASAADGETVSLAPLFTSGTTHAEYDVTDGGGQVLANGFVAGQAYTLTVNMTAASLTEPSLVITIPANYGLDFYTPASNATIAPYMSAKGITNTLDGDGKRILTYWFKDNTTAVGFTLTVRPNLKLNDGDTCSVTAELYGNGGGVAQATASASVRIYNPAVHLGAFRASGGYSQLTYSLNDPVQPVALGGYVYDNYHGRHAYYAMQIVLPLPVDATLGYYDAETFTPLPVGESREVVVNGVAAGSVTYLENHASTDSSGSDITIPKVLLFTLNNSHPLTQGTASSLSFSGLGNLYLQFPESTTTTSVNKYYQSTYTTQVSARTDKSSEYVRLLDHANGYSMYYVYQEYNISNFFYQNLYSSYDQYASSNYLLPVEDNQYFYNRFYNKTGYTIENIVTEYSFDQALYVHKLIFSLSSSASSNLPSAASVVYKTKNGGDLEFSVSMSPENSVLQLSDPTDAFTHLQVVYDKLGHSTGSATVLKAYAVNRESLSTGTYYYRAQIISATCPTDLKSTGTIGSQTQQTRNFLPRTYFQSMYPYLSLSTTTLNKGDSFAVQVYPTYAYPQQLTDLNIYILMPSEFVYSRLTLASGYAGGPPVHSTRPLTVSSAAATAQVPAGAYTVHTFTFPGTSRSNAYAYHRFYFEVGPLVDTATARTNVCLPAAVALNQSNDMFLYSTSSSYQMVDIWDLDGDEDVTESLAASNQQPTVTINAASALSAMSYLTTSYTPGTEAATQSYQYNSTGSYRFYLYNGLASGNNASDVTIDISVPRDNGSVGHDGSTYTSSWNAFLTGAPVFADDSGFLAGATVSYSVDGGSTYSTDNPADWGTVTNVRIVSAPGQSLADGENVVVTLPLQAGYEDDINLSSKAYFGNTMEYKLTSSGSLVNAISIPPVIMQPANVAISGAVYQDLNGNLTKDPTESGNGTSYPVKLYRLATDGAETLQTSTSSNASTGAYTFSVLQPGDYRIRVTKSAANQYFPLGTDDSFADDGTSTLNISGGVTGLSDLNLGILIPRTLTLNMSSVKVVNGTPQQVVPSVSSPLTELEAVTYTSSDPGVVAVAADGTLTYVADGSATITVSVPQLPAVVAAQGAGASDSVTATVSVISQDNTCTISNDPYIGNTPSATKTEAISAASGAYPYSQTFYYFFNRSGYCNAAGHTYAEAVTWSINPVGTTAPGASITQSGANVSLSATGVGTVVLMAEETDEHKFATPLTLTVTIDKANIAGVSFSDLRVTYDGNPHGITIDGALPEGATVAYSNNTSTNAGVFNATATINGGANYNSLTLNATLTIDKANIAGVSFSSLTVPYDGTAKTLLLTGTAPAGTSVAYSNNNGANAGTYSASVTIDGGTNYNSRTLNATLVISKVQLTATVGNYSRVYGEDNPALTVSVSGFVNGETAATAAGYAAPTAGTTATAATGVGTAAITISGGEATNYAFNVSDTGLLGIQPKALTITADNLSKTYGSGHAFAGTELTAVGLVNGDRVTSANISSTGAQSGATVGSYDINISNAVGTGLGNYDIAYIKGTLTVDQKAITVTANNRNKTYGETLALGTTQFSVAAGALVGSDSITGVTLTSDGAAGAATASSYDIMPSAAVGAGLSNYSLSYAKGTLTVGTKALTITANSASKTYGDVLTFTGSEFAASGLVNGDQITSVTLTSDGAAATAPAGSHDILPSAAVGPKLGNYGISYAKGTLSVGKKPITVTAIGQSKTYGETLVLGTSAFSIAADALVSGDSLTGVTLTSDGAVANAAAGAYDITPSAAVGTGLSNYDISFFKGTLSVGTKALIVTSNSTNKTYGDVVILTGNEFAASGLVNGDQVSSVTLTSDGAVANAAAGAYDITPSAAVGTGLSNYDISYVKGTLSVGTKALTVTANSASKTYGDILTFTGSEFATSGLVNGDQVAAVTLTSGGAGETEVVGSYDVVPSAAVGPRLGNYSISYVTGLLTVNEKPITVTAKNWNKTYGETMVLGTSEFSIAADALVGSDSLTGVTLTSDGAAGTATVGNHDIVPSAAVGTGLSNYIISYAKGTLSVGAKELTITANGASKTYGDILTLSGSEFVASGLVNGDQVTSVTLTSGGAAEAAIAKDYEIVPTAAVGPRLGNYSISYVNGTLTVNKKPITVTALGRSKTYGEMLVLGTTQFSTAAGALVGSDSITGVTLTSDGAAGAATIGNYDIVPSAAVGAGLDNYTISYAKGTLGVGTKSLTITANGASKTYGEAITFAGSEFVAAGLVNGDQVTSVNLTSEGAAGAATVHDYEITPSAAVGTGLDNYTISYAKGMLTVGAKGLIITANSVSKTYGDVITFTGSEFEASGLVNDDQVTSVTLTSEGAAEAATVKGYDIVPSAAVGPRLSNYTISYVKGALTVGKKSITVTADDQSKTYGETLALGTTAFQTAAGALVGSDTITRVTLTSAGAGSAAAVGNYEIMPSAAAGTGLGNYEISYAAGNLSVGKRTLSITVNPDQSKVYGQADPTLTYLASGFANGQDEAILTGALTRVAGEEVGSYAIGQGTISAGDNYSISFAGANFAITKAPLTVTADDKSKVYGAEDPVLTYTPSGPLYHGDEYSVISGVTMSAPAGANVDAGEHEITISGGEAANYLVTHVAGELQVTPKTISVVGIAAASKYYDGTNKANLVTRRAKLEGVLLGDDVTLDTTAAVGTFDDALLGIGKVVSVTGLALTGADAGNYVLAAYTTTASIVEEEEQKPPVSGVEIIVNGERHDAATASTTIEEGRTVTTVVVDPAKLSARLEAEGERAVVTIPVDTGAERVVGELTGQMVKEMEQAVATVQVATERAVYTLPAEQINIDAVADQLGEAVSLQDVKVHVQIAEPNPETVRVVEDQMNRENYLLVVPPVEFSITCNYGDQTVEVSRFNAYVERQIAIPAGVEPSRVTTAVVVEADGTLRHVPTKVIVVDGKHYAQVNSLTNSTYTVIWNPLTYQDMVGHWAKGAVEDMGSRLVMTGDSAEAFGARRDITRGEFAITIVKALGLQPMNGDSLFIDVAADSELHGYVLTAAQYGLMGGLPGGIFGPTQSISREEAMSIVVAAMRVSGVQNQLQPREVETLLAGYADAAQVGVWSRNVVADCLQSGLIGGRPGKQIAPKDNLTRAEAAAIVQRLLRRAGLI